MVKKVVKKVAKKVVKKVVKNLLLSNIFIACRIRATYAFITGHRGQCSFLSAMGVAASAHFVAAATKCRIFNPLCYTM